MDPAIRLTQPTEGGDRGGDRVGPLVFVPHGATTGRSPHHVDAEPFDGCAIVVCEGGFVAAERQTGGIPAVETQQGAANPVCFQEQRLVEGHVPGPRTPDWVDGDLPIRLSRNPPPAGRYTRDCGRQTTRRCGSPAATPCGRGAPRRGMRRAPASRGGAPCPPADRRDSAARC